jgi:hypothetical protein
LIEGQTTAREAIASGEARVTVGTDAELAQLAAMFAAEPASAADLAA